MQSECHNMRVLNTSFDVVISLYALNYGPVKYCSVPVYKIVCFKEYDFSDGKIFHFKVLTRAHD